MIAGERLTHLELRRVPATVLATVAVTREEEGVRHLPAESTRHVNELRESDDHWPWHRESLGADHFILVYFDDLGLPIDHEAKRPSHRDHRERLERRIQSQAANDHA